MMTALDHSPGRCVRRSNSPDARISLALPARLEQKGFSVESPIYQAVDKAFDSLHTLHATLRYESCDGGVGKPREDDAKP